VVAELEASELIDVQPRPMRVYSMVSSPDARFLKAIDIAKVGPCSLYWRAALKTGRPATTAKYGHQPTSGHRGHRIACGTEDWLSSGCCGHSMHTARGLKVPCAVTQCGWAVGENYKMSARDAIRGWWRTANMKRARAQELGLDVPELPEKPDRYTCKNDHTIINSHVLGLDHVACVVHWISDDFQRCSATLPSVLILKLEQSAGARGALQWAGL
jgi:hypothetical protein